MSIPCESFRALRAACRSIGPAALAVGAFAWAIASARLEAATPPPDPVRLAENQPRHDPADPALFVPISAGLGLADVTFWSKPGQFARVELHVEMDGAQAAPGAGRREHRAVLMSKVEGAERDVYTARIATGGPRARYSAWGVRDLPGTKAKSHTPSPRFEAEIKPALPTPDWAKGAVWYQVFPERFRNGNALNDPNGSGVFLARWNSDWYAVQPGEMEARQAREGRDPDKRRRGGGDLYQVIFDRRYGGDLQGVVEKLDHLRALGVNAIYLNPIFQARSLHKYDASDYRHIDSALANPREAGPSLPIDETYYTPPAGETDDPATWTWTPADRYFVDVFLPACKARGMRVIIDGVWNHTGREFWAFQDLQKRGRASAYSSWYQAEFAGDGKLTGWSGWENKNGYLPEFRQVKGVGRDWDQTVEKGDLNAGAKRHVFDVTRRWMDPNGDGDPSDGVDGWRLDVVPDVGMEFWRSWRAHVKAINPDAILVAEVWHDADEYMQGDTFDTHMHYPFAFPVLDWLAIDRRVDAAKVAEAMGPAFSNPASVNLIHQNLFASHDTDRYVSMLYNPGRRYDQGNNVQSGNAGGYKVGKPNQETYELSIVGVAIQACHEGAPMVYYGDELGMFGADDPTCRKPAPWPDLVGTLGPMANAEDAADPWVLERYRAWMGLRDGSSVGSVLRYGRTIYVGTGSPDVLAFERQLNDERLLLIANRGTEPFDTQRFLSQYANGVVADGLVRPLPARSAHLWSVRLDPDSGAVSAALVRE